MEREGEGEGVRLLRSSVLLTVEVKEPPSTPGVLQKFLLPRAMAEVRACVHVCVVGCYPRMWVSEGGTESSQCSSIHLCFGKGSRFMD